MNKKQIANLIGAGLMSGLILAAAFLLNGRQETNALEVAPQASVIQVDPIATEDVQALQELLAEMQAREVQYLQQLAAAQTYIDEQTAANETATYGEGEEDSANKEYGHEEEEDDDDYEDAYKEDDD